MGACNWIRNTTCFVSAMFCCLIALILLWCVHGTSHAMCSSSTICVARENGKDEKECQHYHHVVQKLSDLTVNETRCANVQIYLTSGIHNLEENLIFGNSLRNISIQGASQGHPAIIQCLKNSGIRFSEKRPKRASISNIVLSYCQVGITHAALVFRHAQFIILENVTVKNTNGYGIHIRVSENISLFNCTFINNSRGHIHIVLDGSGKVKYNINISRTKLYEGNSYGSGGLYVIVASDISSNISIVNSEFNGNRGVSASHMMIKSRSQRNTLNRNIHVAIENSTFINGMGSPGVLVDSIDNTRGTLIVTFRNSTFSSNEFGAFHIGAITSRYNVTLIFENCTLTRCYNINYDCSVLEANEVHDITLRNVHVANNNCTGIKLAASRLMLRNVINITGNHGWDGGAILLKGSELVFSRGSKVYIANNTADRYGGGIYSDETCDTRNIKAKCFFHFEGNHTSIEFSGNHANQGGDVIFGGCLSKCAIEINENWIIINKSDTKNILWDFMSLQSDVSQSTIADYPNRVAFCKNESVTNSTYYTAACGNSHNLSVYRGEEFTVPLMTVDDACVPSVEFIEARSTEPNIVLHRISSGKTRNYCHKFSYSITGVSALNMTTIEIGLENTLPNMPPALGLSVRIKECPFGFESKSGEKCNCQAIMKSYKIKCISNNYSLDIPPQTWMGSVVMGKRPTETMAIHTDCQYCKKKEKVVIAEFSSKDSDKLCTFKRTGIMCGACVANYSLQLGGYECADCSDSTYKRVLLLLAIFAVIGIALVLFLLVLNLTVSTGMINGLLFYSNIAYLNSDTLLPIIRESNSTHRQNTVRILSTFLAWMNLDLGIVTCFFDGYDIYISTWMQFVFPLYIWLLILIIVLASRYSSKISKITTSNTVSVLATLLLLSYAKLLKTSIDASSHTDIKSIFCPSRYRVWILDGNIPHLQGRHIPLFLMSLVTIFVYILPFTLLILLGPLVQAKSHYRFLHWINKLKPFLDAFYGPYTSRYRYWPGILLLARVIVLLTYTYFSLGDSSVMLLTVSVIVAVLLVCWMLIGKTQNTSLHQKMQLNILELFFLLNLEIFTIASIYYSHVTENLRNQQVLAVVMVGSVLATFCGILVYQLLSTIMTRCKVEVNIHRFFPTFIKATPGNNIATVDQDTSRPLEAIINSPTHSIVELPPPNSLLREPLLTN